MQLSELLAMPAALPSIPKVVALLMAELNREEPDLRTVNQLINTDPGLATRVLQLANSAHFQLAGRIGSVSEALAIMGLNHVKSLVSAAALSGAFRAVPGIVMAQFWRYSLDVAKISRALAGNVRENQGTAFTAGLIHCAGELVMHLGMGPDIQSLDRTVPPLDMRRARAEQRSFGFAWGEVGAGLCRSWNFPQQIVDALQYQHAPFDNDAYEPLAGILHLATWRARAREAQLGEKELATSFPDVVGLTLGMDIDGVLQQDPIDWSSGSEAAMFA
ncbi:HDOD domain-containing protein [Xylophilus rhododendri]|uniref:HDOD domain-containing protein n=1 Tax=Xylophilus rhododendri TaxID=2697032 RepID=A0A857J0P6_9BURK|nr:HDOD domain-containing protein [Xylophilus rhododendri]QHI96528.1 HDOD domain-containing protein [Xylophilus rhododendri]